MWVCVLVIVFCVFQCTAMFPVCFRNTGVVFRGVFAGKGKRILEQEREVCMKNRISDETVAYIGILAKLELSEEERKRAGNDMANMLDYMDKLKELDTSGVAPTSHLFPTENVFREDIVTNGDGQKDALFNAPAKKEHGFLAPKTIGMEEG